MAGFVVGEDHEDVAAKLVRHQARGFGRLGLADPACVQVDIDDMRIFQSSDLVSDGGQLNSCGSILQAHDAGRLLEVQSLCEQPANLPNSLLRRAGAENPGYVLLHIRSVLSVDDWHGGPRVL